MPSLLEYLSYNCNFMGILAGPLCSYKDYIIFIEGRSFHVAQSDKNGKEEPHRARAEPSPSVSVGAAGVISPGHVEMLMCSSFVRTHLFL